MNAVIEERTIQNELRQIQEKNNGICSPKAVVEFAKDPNTALHKKFTWDDTAAAKQYRLWQARQILRVYVMMKTPKNNEPVRVRAFLSLPSDRNASGGYRPITAIISSESLRAEMLSMAKRELKTFREKYKTLSELAEVHSAIDKILTPQE